MASKFIEFKNIDFTGKSPPECPFREMGPVFIDPDKVHSISPHYYYLGVSDIHMVGGYSHKVAGSSKEVMEKLGV